MPKWVFFLEKYVGAMLVYLLGFTWRYQVVGTYPALAIFAFWHENLLPMLYHRKNEKACVMVSSSNDGELIAGPARVLGFQTARGSSTRGYLGAVRQMKKISKKYAIAITPDGPKGPAYQVKSGLTYLSYACQLPIIGMSVEIDRYWQVATWDKMIIPKPFAKIKVVYSEEIYICTKEEVEAKKEFIASQIKSLTNNID